MLSTRCLTWLEESVFLFPSATQSFIYYTNLKLDEPTHRINSTYKAKLKPTLSFASTIQRYTYILQKALFNFLCASFPRCNLFNGLTETKSGNLNSNFLFHSPMK